MFVICSYWNTKINRYNRSNVKTCFMKTHNTFFSRKIFLKKSQHFLKILKLLMRHCISLLFSFSCIHNRIFLVLKINTKLWRVFEYVTTKLWKFPDSIIFFYIGNSSKIGQKITKTTFLFHKVPSRNHTFRSIVCKYIPITLNHILSYI